MPRVDILVQEGRWKHGLVVFEVALRRVILRVPPKSPRLHIWNGKEASRKRQTGSIVRGRVAASTRSLSLLALDS
jgi:hypothetical protein